MQRVIPLLFFFGASGVRLRAPRQSPVVLDEWDAGPARKLSLEELEREDYRDYGFLLYAACPEAAQASSSSCSAPPPRPFHSHTRQAINAANGY